MRRLQRLWQSPILMSWGNLAVKSSSLFLLLPLVLGKLQAEDSVIWFAVATLFSFQMLVDFGLTATTTRFIAYANGGLCLEQLMTLRNGVPSMAEGSSANWSAIAGLYVSLRQVYRAVGTGALCVGGLMLLVSLGPAIARSTAPAWNAAAACFAVLVAAGNAYGNSYISVLQGCGRVASVQRIQMVHAVLSIVAAAVSLLISDSVAIAVVSYYAPNLSAITILRRQCQSLLPFPTGLPALSDDQRLLRRRIRSRLLLDSVKSGFGVLLSQGMVQLSGLWVTRVCSPELASGYMLAIQLVRTVSTFAQVPFYAHLPRLASLFSKPETRSEMIQTALRGMTRSIALYLAMMLSVAVVIAVVGQQYGSQLPSLRLWGLLSVAFLAERFGAMHLQLYTLTGDVIWHSANGMAALMTVACAPILFQIFQLDGLAMALLVGQVFFYVPYCTARSRGQFGLPIARLWLLFLSGFVISVPMIFR